MGEGRNVVRIDDEATAIAKHAAEKKGIAVGDAVSAYIKGYQKRLDALGRYQKNNKLAPKPKGSRKPRAKKKAAG